MYELIKGVIIKQLNIDIYLELFEEQIGPTDLKKSFSSMFNDNSVGYLILLIQMMEKIHIIK